MSSNEQYFQTPTPSTRPTATSFSELQIANEAKIDPLPEWTKFQLPDIPEPDDTEVIKELNKQFEIGTLFQKMRESN